MHVIKSRYIKLMSPLINILILGAINMLIDVMTCETMI